MKSLTKVNTLKEVDKEFEMQRKRELMEKLDGIIGSDEDILLKLISTYKDAEEHGSGQALQVRLDTIKYLMKLKGIDVEKENKPINIAIFNYGNKSELEY